MATWNCQGGGRHECHDTNGTMAMTIMTARQWYRGYGNINRHITQTSWQHGIAEEEGGTNAMTPMVPWQ